MEDIHKIMTEGIVFKPCKKEQGGTDVKTKAKKKSYVTGAHGSGSAKMKAEYRRKRTNRRK